MDTRSPLDKNGHGTHVASTAAGVHVPDASFYGYARGTAAGTAPKARISVYKVCNVYSRCQESDMLAGLDQAVK
ncbi:S8 family serine peptidase, partial [Acinetobacter baumannii]|uniref:S8 family serine peptidase n=1 Tax=Acinetobacter baumannii TaxID=470 RepID=UPI003316AE1D